MSSADLRAPLVYVFAAVAVAASIAFLGMYFSTKDQIEALDERINGLEVTLAAVTDADRAGLAEAMGRLEAAISAASQATAAAKEAAERADRAAQVNPDNDISRVQKLANQALAAAQASQACCDATNETIDRLFRRSMTEESLE
jgi:hypothetical protein